MEEKRRQSMEMESFMSINDYTNILKRRKWSLVLPTLVISTLASILALILPPCYKSTATILIEEQQIPTEYVSAPITSYAEQRIQQIHRRIISAKKLIEIINRFHVYENLRSELTTDELVDRLRSNIEFTPISTEVLDRRIGRAVQSTTAFTLSYQSSESAKKVQQVTSTLTSLFLEENLNVRSRQTQEASRFLEDELNKVKKALDAQGIEIARFKEKNINRLPDMLQVNIQSLNNIEQTIDTLKETLRSLKEREGYMETQLINISPNLQAQHEDKKRLDELKVLLVNLKSRFTDEYPDVIKTKNEIVKLESQLAEQKLSSAAIDTVPENPAYINLASQLSGIQADIKSVEQQIADSKNKEAQYRKRIEETPRVEETYKTLTIRRNNTRAKYDDLMRKLLEAQVSQGLEVEQKGERFTLVDPPRLPEKPFKPNRLAIILIGVVLGSGVGVGFAALREFSDNAVHSAGRLSKATSFPVLVTIPYIMTPEKIAVKRLKEIFMAGAIVAAVIVSIIMLHFNLVRLDVIYGKFMRLMKIA